MSAIYAHDIVSSTKFPLRIESDAVYLVKTQKCYSIRSMNELSIKAEWDDSFGLTCFDAFHTKV